MAAATITTTTTKTTTTTTTKTTTTTTKQQQQRQHKANIRHSSDAQWLSATLLIVSAALRRRTLVGTNVLLNLLCFFVQGRLQAVLLCSKKAVRRCCGYQNLVLSCSLCAKEAQAQKKKEKGNKEKEEKRKKSPWVGPEK